MKETEELALLSFFDTLPRRKPVILLPAATEKKLLELWPEAEIPENMGGVPVLRESQEEGGWRFPEGKGR